MTAVTAQGSDRAARRKPKRAKQLGVTDEEYAAMLERQGGGCAICGARPKTRRLHVDHDHATGKVRGLLCHRCNRTLPTWITDQWLVAALMYLYGIKPESGDQVTIDWPTAEEAELALSGGFDVERRS